MAQPNRRKTYLINPRFQWRFIGFMAAVSLLAIFMLFASNILFFRTMEQEALSVSLARDNPYFVKERFGEPVVSLLHVAAQEELAECELLLVRSSAVGMSLKLSLSAPKIGLLEPTAAKSVDRGSSCGARICEERRRWPKC